MYHNLVSSYQSINIFGGGDNNENVPSIFSLSGRMWIHQSAIIIENTILSLPKYKLCVFSLSGTRFTRDDDRLTHLQHLHVTVRFISWQRHTEIQLFQDAEFWLTQKLMSFIRYLLIVITYKLRTKFPPNFKSIYYTLSTCPLWRSKK